MLQQLVDKGSFIEIKKNDVFISGFYNFFADKVIPVKTTWYYMNGEKKAFNTAPHEVKQQ